MSVEKDLFKIHLDHRVTIEIFYVRLHFHIIVFLRVISKTKWKNIANETNIAVRDNLLSKLMMQSIKPTKVRINADLEKI